MNIVNMDKIMVASLGENSGKLRANFKKTVNVKQYETEVVELESSVDIDRGLNGVERMLVASIMQAQMEYTGYVQMYCKGLVTQSQLAERKLNLESDINTIKAKGEELLGKPLDYLFEILDKDKNGE